MAIDAWLPVGTTLPDGAVTQRVLHGAESWQIVATRGGGRALLANDELAKRWTTTGLIDGHTLQPIQFGSDQRWALSTGAGQALVPVAEDRSPNSKVEAIAFAQALRETRSIDLESALQDAIYVEKLTRLLPTYSITSRTSDDVVLGYWLTGGANVSATSPRRARQMLSWLGGNNLDEIVAIAGIADEDDSSSQTEKVATRSRPTGPNTTGKLPEEPFDLAGRPGLTAFFNEHVIDILRHRDRYRALGIEFPSAMILHGPPGTGKTYAVDQLVDYLGWPSFAIEASSVASPYIHETSRKVADVFEQAIKSAPSVLVIDEMEAFLADREMGSGHHRVEEVAEFLRRIPEATKSDVLIIGMTNRLEMIDTAILRRGRFDHLVNVDFASEEEIRSLLTKLVELIPRSEDVDVAPIARHLAGRPLSDVAFVVREGARLAARAGRSELDQASLNAALMSSPARAREGQEKRRIGFV